jgi:serine phosphatase RsbU (regulator of sigma subunit)
MDPVLTRQLKRLALPPEVVRSEGWQRFIDSVNEHYLHMQEDRALLSRSIELSTLEMDGLRRRVESQRDRLLAVISGISDALAQFATALHSSEVGSARIALAGRLQAILDDSRMADERSTEITNIRDNLLRLADQLGAVLTRSQREAGLRKELEIARAVQQLIVPAEAVIDAGAMQFAGHFQTAEECGGDWWNVAELPDGRTLLVVGDVTGHGIASAIITGAAKATCELAIHILGRQLVPGELLRMMNRALHRVARETITMTCVAVVLDPRTHTLIAANAGHPFPMLVRRGIMHPVMAEGPQLGAGPDAAFADAQIEIQTGDLIVAFTDGVPECENDRGEQFTERRLRTIVQRVAGTGVLAVRDALVDALTSFRNGQPLADDVTLVVGALA